MTADQTLATDDWEGEMGRKWLARLDRFESMIGPAGAALMTHAGFKAGDRVIDIGCGGGGTTLEIARRVAPTGTVLGLDISGDLIEAGRGRARQAGLGNIAFENADASVARPAGAPFDRMFSRFGCMFFADPYPAYANLHRMLAPGGRIDLGVWAPARDNGWMASLAGVLGKYIELPAPVPRAPGPFAMDDPDYIRDLLRQGGFSAVTIDPWTGDQLVGGAEASPAQAVDFVLSVLSVGEALAKADPAVRDQGTEELRALFERFHTARGIVMPAKVWLVSAYA